MGVTDPEKLAGATMHRNRCENTSHSYCQHEYHMRFEDACPFPLFPLNSSGEGGLPACVWEACSGGQQWRGSGDTRKASAAPREGLKQLPDPEIRFSAGYAFPHVKETNCKNITYSCFHNCQLNHGVSEPSSTGPPFQTNISPYNVCVPDVIDDLMRAPITSTSSCFDLLFDAL
eukprot:6197621-Pleurochrysis_carterae.AAC.2